MLHPGLGAFVVGDDFAASRLSTGESAEANGSPNAAHHVAEAHRILSALQVPLEKHPELEQAIDNLEMALSILANAAD